MAWARETEGLFFRRPQTRALETDCASHLPQQALMQRAGLAIAKFAIAIAPHARTIWIACGPGNNGGDGYEAAKHLKSWGKLPVVTCLGGITNLPVGVEAMLSEAIHRNTTCALTHYLELGKFVPGTSGTASWIEHINSNAAPVLSVDVPSGLNADTGADNGLFVKANYTLSLLTLKPGLFTANGRAACGEIWFDALGIDASAKACAYLNAAPAVGARAHNTHKGSFGDVCIVGGVTGMTGAALLAARAALHGGAGRVFVGLLDPSTAQLDADQPELMFRSLSDMAYDTMSVVAGCGGGNAIALHLPRILTRSSRLVLDADALNAIATDTTLQNLLSTRPAQTTVLTPHPLEAARLMGTSTAEVQAHRLEVAQALSNRFSCVVVLKGSGTVIAAPGVAPHINTSGNARLATAGTGDVLAGLIGARLAAGGDAFSLACGGVFLHGQVADRWPSTTTLTAQTLSLALLGNTGA